MSLSPQAVSDEALMRSYQRGDKAALSSLFVRHARRLQAFFYCQLFESEAAAALTEKSWLKLHEMRKTFTEQPFLPWLYSLAVKLRREHDRLRTKQAAAPEKKPTTAHGLPLLAALSELPDSYREVVVLRSLVGLDEAAIATVLGATLEAVTRRGEQGYAKLAELTDKGGAEALSRSELGAALLALPQLPQRSSLVELEHCAREVLQLVAKAHRPARPSVPLMLLMAVILLGLAAAFIAKSPFH